MHPLFNIDSKNTAIIVIDVQEKLFPVMHQKDLFLKHLSIFLSGSQIQNIPILVTEQYPKGLGKTLETITPYLKPNLTFEKIKFSAYSDSIKNHLDKQGINTIILVGMETHICVFQTARDFLKNGYQVMVPYDCVASRTNENKENGLHLLESMGAIITNYETLLFDWLEVAEGTHFKEVSKLIK